MSKKPNTELKNYYGSFLSQIGDFQNWARKENKFTALRACYSFSRLLFVKYQILHSHREKLIITGCGRSATKFVSQLFKSLGIRIGHERLEKHGIASWTLVPDTYTMLWGPSYYLIRHLDMPIVHQVRNPLDTISSVMTVFSDQKSWNFINKFIPINEYDSMILRSMKYWYFWNLLAEKKAVYTYRVEEINSSLKRILNIGGFHITEDIDTILKITSKRIHSRKHPILSWSELKKTNYVLANKILALARRYGYDL